MENLQMAKFPDIDIVNRTKMFYYTLSVPPYTDQFLIEGNMGFPYYYRIEIRFIDVEYLACAFYLDETYAWRKATPEEAQAVFSMFSDGESRATVYCLEEISRPHQRVPRKYFIVAHAVEITVYYDANNASHVASLGLS